MHAAQVIILKAMFVNNRKSMVVAAARFQLTLFIANVVAATVRRVRAFELADSIN